MEKVQVVVLGLSANPANTNAYALILKEVEGNRRLPIIIGAFEAQAIALEMEGVIPPRPMTHDLTKNIIEALGATLEEVFINELRDGTFYARIKFDNPSIDIDARPSDAIALAVRFSAPIYVDEEILEETGLVPQENEDVFNQDEEDDLQMIQKEKEKEEQPKPKTLLEKLQVQLDKAISEEDYERAAKIRDEIRKITESS